MQTTSLASVHIQLSQLQCISNWDSFMTSTATNAVCLALSSASQCVGFFTQNTVIVPLSSYQYTATDEFGFTHKMTEFS